VDVASGLRLFLELPRHHFQLQKGIITQILFQPSIINPHALTQTLPIINIKHKHIRFVIYLNSNT